LTDPNARNNAMQNIARQWMRTDPTAAAVWINQSSLSADVKQGLLKPPTTSGGNTTPAIQPGRYITF